MSATVKDIKEFQAECFLLPPDLQNACLAGGGFGLNVDPDAAFGQYQLVYIIVSRNLHKDAQKLLHRYLGNAYIFYLVLRAFSLQVITTEEFNEILDGHGYSLRLLIGNLAKTLPV